MNPLLKKQALDETWIMWNDPDYATHQHHSDPNFTTQNGKDYAGRGSTEVEDGALQDGIPANLLSVELGKSGATQTITDGPVCDDNSCWKEADADNPHVTTPSLVDPDDAEFFKEGEDFSPAEEKITEIISSEGFHYGARVADGTTLWFRGNKERIQFNPETGNIVYSKDGEAILECPVNELRNHVNRMLKSAAREFHETLKSMLGQTAAIRPSPHAVFEQKVDQSSGKPPEQPEQQQAPTQNTGQPNQNPEIADQTSQIASKTASSNRLEKLKARRGGEEIPTPVINTIPEGWHFYDPQTGKEVKDDSPATFEKHSAKTMYHVTHTKTVSAIEKKGILPLQNSNWVKGEKGGDRYGEGEIFAFDHPADAVRWAAKMGWDFYKDSGSPKISIVSFTPGKEKWEVDTADPMSQATAKGKWMKAHAAIKPAQITAITPMNLDLAKAVIAGEGVKLGAVTKSYGSGTPFGGTPNDPSEDVEEDEADKTAAVKQAEIGIKETPKFLPPRDDMRRHLDEGVKKEIQDDVMDGVKDDVSITSAVEGEIVPKRTGNWKLYVFVRNGKTESEIARWYVGDKKTGVQRANEMYGPLTHEQENELYRVGNLVLDDVILKITNWEYPKAGIEKPPQHRLQSDDQSEYALDQDDTEQRYLQEMSAMEDEAKDAFMLDPAMLQDASDAGITMNDLWQEVGKNFTQNFWELSYAKQGSIEVSEGVKCPNCKNSEWKSVEDGEEDCSTLRECLICRSFF